jgi:O-antigen/teichoic acid export membrane protein
MLGQTLFPAFAHVQNDKERVNRILVEVTSWMILAGLPGVVVIYLCGHSLLLIMYGGRYVAAAGPLSVAAAVVFLTVLNAPITCALIGMGRPELHRHAVAASAIIMLITIYPACKLLGVVGGQVAALLATAAGYAFQVVRMRTLTGLDLGCYGKEFVRAMVVSGGLLAVGFGARYLGLATRPLANVALAVGSCIVAYALCVPTFLKIKQDSLGSI